MKKKKIPFIAGALTLALASVVSAGVPVAQAQPDSAQAAPADPSKPAVYRGRTSTWYLRNTRTTGVADTNFVYGSPRDTPFMGDWNGDGVDTPGIYRGGRFYLRNSNSTGIADIVVDYGLAGGRDVPLVGDWDGNGTDTIGVYRSAESIWYLRNSNTTGAADLTFRYGDWGDVPVVGDWDGNGTDTPVILRFPSEADAVVYERNSNTGGLADKVTNLRTSETADMVESDFDGNGLEEFASFGLFDARWRTVAGDFQFGEEGDIALVW
jgi:hypothetical protein